MGTITGGVTDFLTESVGVRVGGIKTGAELAGAGFQIGNAADDAANDDATS